MLGHSRPRAQSSPDARILQAEAWLKQARSDHAALQRLFRRYQQRTPGQLPSTPEVAVYLLQQSVEKAAKALMVARGHGEDTLKKRPYGHDSLTVVLEFFRQQLSVPGFSKALDILLRTQSLEVDDAEEVRKSIEDLMRKAQAGDLTELAVLPPEAVRAIVNLMQTLRERFVGHLRASLRSKTPLRFNSHGVEDSTAIDLLWDIATSALQTDPLPADQMAAAKEIIGIVFGSVDRQVAKGLRDIDGQRITIDRSQLLSDVFLPLWALLSLYLLAALTFPHEASSRYPTPVEAPDDARDAARQGLLGTRHYTPALGIVALLPELNLLIGLVLQDIKPLLSNASVFKVSGR